MRSGPGALSTARTVPLWSDILPTEPARPPLSGDTDADVAIVGGGFSGLWTAYYLAGCDPSLRIVVLEAERVGFGASGRNGGWCSALLPMSPEVLAARYGPESARAMQEAMNATVAEVGRVVAEERIDCGFAHGGSLILARNEAQRRRLTDELGSVATLGVDTGQRWLEPGELRSRLPGTDALGAVFTPHCAAVQPAALVRGLARAAERRGVVIHEQSRVTSLLIGGVGLAVGRVRAPVVVRATEAYTTRLPHQRRALVPLYSLVIATEPLPSDVWARLGWAGRETVGDGRQMVIYAQRTADGRIAFGGRGAPYHWGSRIRSSYDIHDAVHAALAGTLAELFPAAAGAAITHRWGGPLGVPRDWHASVGYERASGLAWAGGYVGDGVATANLAGRTLAAGITSSSEQDLLRLPWYGHRSPSWEPEPLRWPAVRALAAIASSIDAHEQRTGRTPRLRSAILSRLTG